MSTQDFLLELGTEELPPKLLKQLSNALSGNLTKQLSELNLSFDRAETFATPRRLAVLVHNLQLQQNNQTIERKGPAVTAPEQAVAGFAKSCGVSKEDLTQKDLNGADYYFFTQEKKGLKTQDLLPEVVDIAIKKIPITRAMRWGNLDFTFVRPVHWLVMLLEGTVVKANIMGLESGNSTRGLRWTGEQEFTIDTAKNYQKTLMDKAQIEVDFDLRKETIRQQVNQEASKKGATAVIDEALLDEVCALVEYPCAFSGIFDERFLQVPEEALISAMKAHQKYFYMVDDGGKLLPAFISVANIESSDLSVIINGNERVIRPRLTDSEFFWEQDKSTSLASRLSKLDSVLFMKSLGSMGDKAKRIESLATYIASVIGANEKHSARAGLLAKTDLVTEMVGEFADLQGVMGGYYAKNDGEDLAVATAISEHYHPRFAGDVLPSTKEGLSVAIADKVDTIVGIYGIGQKPTGSKDPYALKRAGLGLLRMMIESKSQLDLLALVRKSAELYEFNDVLALEICDFIAERLSAYYQEQNIEKNIARAVLHSTDDGIQIPKNYIVYDWHLRIQALNVFMQDENAQSLVEANKRIKNILKDEKLQKTDVNFSTSYDQNLYDAVERVDTKNDDYAIILKEFLQLKPVIDDFFDNVMVNDEDSKIRHQRLKLISKIRQVFLSVADITYLSK
ncbi:Glycyl-tRNA synthetase beta chain (EC [Bathymodiolus brooksi thiotrophic gill symbiont]|nr:Glycyl-tRNA synthetase beta chain (EC [Bathymodiolus brooksi thiotrophic gill symbiont]